MRRSLLVAVLMFLAAPALAEEVELWYVFPNATANTLYNIYRAPCNAPPINNICSSEGSFNLLGGNFGATVFDDPTIVPGASYSYYVTEVCTLCGTKESSPTNHWAIMIPLIGGGTGILNRPVSINAAAR